MLDGFLRFQLLLQVELFDAQREILDVAKVEVFESRLQAVRVKQLAECECAARVRHHNLRLLDTHHFQEGRHLLFTRHCDGRRVIDLDVVLVDYVVALKIP